MNYKLNGSVTLQKIGTKTSDRYTVDRKFYRLVSSRLSNETKFYKSGYREVQQNLAELIA